MMIYPNKPLLITRVFSSNSLLEFKYVSFELFCNLLTFFYLQNEPLKIEGKNRQNQAKKLLFASCKATFC